MNTNVYSTLDTSKAGPLATALEDLCKPEAQSAIHGSIEITSSLDTGMAGPNLTPAMNQWLKQMIESFRLLAWSDAAAWARRIRVREVDGIVLEIEEDRIERDKQLEITRIRDRFNNRYSKSLTDVARLKREYEEERQRGDNRDAKLPSVVLEWALLLPLILIPESLLNFSSFQRVWYIQSDFQALAATIFVGLALAWAAYLLGLFTLRARYYLHPIDKEKRWKGISMLVGGLLLLCLGIGLVAQARYYLLSKLIQDAVLSGTPPPSMIISVGSLLLGNLIAFLLGAILTFMLNDPNERYYEKAKSLKTEEAKLHKVRETELLRPIAAREEAAGREVEQMKNKNRQMAAAPEYGQFRSSVAGLQAKDAEILGMLESYRSSLAANIRSFNPSFAFLQRASLERAEAARRVDLAEFLLLGLRLWRMS